MTTKQNTPVVVAPKATYREVTGTRQAPKTAYRALRQQKGYGRVALADALGITTSALWKIENHAEGAELAKAMKALEALPTRKAPAKATKAPAKATKAPAKGNAKKATPKAKASGSDLL